MTNLTALDALIDAVDRGEFPVTWDELNMAGVAHNSYGLPCRGYAWSAYNGSLDAAKALHDALLPGWRVEVFNIDGEVVLRRSRPIDRAYGEAMWCGEVARAWMLAILRAYRAQIGGDQTQDV